MIKYFFDLKTLKPKTYTKVIDLNYSVERAVRLLKTYTSHNPKVNIRVENNVYYADILLGTSSNELHNTDITSLIGGVDKYLNNILVTSDLKK